ncbi:MAG: hypothetical protein WDN29_10320 [Methylovirgula sp.]
MMPDATNPGKAFDNAVRVTDENGKILATFTGDDLKAWRQFQLDAVKNFNVVVTDSSMPVGISKTIRGPDKRNDKLIASG